MNEYQEFGKKLREEEPGITMNEIADRWKKHKEENKPQTGGEGSGPETTLSDDDRFEDNVPGMKREATKTIERNMSDVINEKLIQLKDLATMEVMLDTNVRMKHRMASIKKISSAESIKIQGHFKTIAPQIHVCKLQGQKITNDESKITFGVYAVDKKNNKREFKNYSYEEIEYEDAKGIAQTRMKKKHLSSEYRVEFEVTETIRTGKAITREKIKIDVENK